MRDLGIRIVVHAAYTDRTGVSKSVRTLEEEEYPHCYHGTVGEVEGEESHLPTPITPAGTTPTASPAAVEVRLKEHHLTIQENQRGTSFDSLLGPYLHGASQITVTDPYIRHFYQIRNFMELLETILRVKSQEEKVAVHLVTTEDEFRGEQQRESLGRVETACSMAGIRFTWEFDATRTIHARHIVTNHGWKISMDRGLDVFQQYEMNDGLAFPNRLRQFRSCKQFEVTFIRTDKSIGTVI